MVKEAGLHLILEALCPIRDIPGLLAVILTQSIRQAEFKELQSFFGAIFNGMYDLQSLVFNESLFMKLFDMKDRDWFRRDLGTLCHGSV